MGVSLSLEDFTFALLLALGFHCMLRTSEMLSLSHRHVVFHQQNAAASVVIPGSKTSQGNPQVILVEDKKLVAFATSVVRTNSDDLLWPAGAHRFRALFAQCLQERGFGPHDYTPYFVRRDGCAWWFQSALSLDLVVTRGRWQCAKPVNMLTKAPANWLRCNGLVDNAVSWLFGGTAVEYIGFASKGRNGRDEAKFFVLPQKLELRLLSHW